jgi:hypothetical protein
MQMAIMHFKKILNMPCAALSQVHAALLQHFATLPQK